jgi:hypothetical protein
MTNKLTFDTLLQHMDALSGVLELLPRDLLQTVG